MMRFQPAAIAATILLGLSGAAMAAPFAQPTRCVGQMIFPDLDGSIGTYQMDVTLSDAGYGITSTDMDTDEVTVDEGTCTTYLSGTCRHILSADGNLEDGYYDFGLRSMTQTSFVYEETWDDGSSGRTILTCRPDQ